MPKVMVDMTFEEIVDAVKKLSEHEREQLFLPLIRIMRRR